MYWQISLGNSGYKDTGQTAKTQTSNHVYLGQQSVQLHPELWEWKSCGSKTSTHWQQAITWREDVINIYWEKILQILVSIPQNEFLVCWVRLPHCAILSDTLKGWIPSSVQEHSSVDNGEITDETLKILARSILFKDRTFMR